MTLDVQHDDFYINDEDSPWHGRYLYNLYEDAFMPWEWQEELMIEAHSLGLTFFSTPFDETAVDFLESLNVPAYKIASFENTDIPLLQKVAQTGKPIIISCGLISLIELEATIDAIRHAGCQQYALLKCTTSYPAPVADSNISTIPDMRDRFKCEVGLSDHTLGIGSALAAVAQGASLIEKHLTLNRNDGGVDSTFSIEPSEFHTLSVESKNAWLALGVIHYGPTKAETETLKSRRSIYIAQNMEPGQIVTEHQIRRVRPGNGLAPVHYHELIGKKAKRRIPKGTPATWDLFD
jgi:N-acetylneuraminate synthase